MREFHSLLIGNMRDGHGLLYDFGISGVHTAYIRPDFQDVGIYCIGEYGGRIIGPAPAQGGRIPVNGGGDEPSQNEDLVFMVLYNHFTITIGKVIIDRCLSMCGIGLDNLPTIYMGNIQPLGKEVFANDVGREQFSITDDLIGSFRGDLTY